MSDRRKESPLAQKIAAGSPKGLAVSSSRTSKLGERKKIAGGRRGQVVEVPELGRMYIELPGVIQWSSLEADARAATKDKGLTLEDGLPYAATYESEIATRTLAACSFDPDDHTVPFGSFAEWADLDTDLVNGAWNRFGDVREALDPMASTTISEDESFVIASAVKKKEPRILRSYGAAKLSAYMLSLDDRPSTSLKPNSPTSESSPD